MSAIKKGHTQAGCRFPPLLFACFISTPFLFFSSVSLKRSGVHIWIRAQQLPDGGGGSAAIRRPQLGSLHSCGCSDFNHPQDSFCLSTTLKTLSLGQIFVNESREMFDSILVGGGLWSSQFELYCAICSHWVVGEARVRDFNYCCLNVYAPVPTNWDSCCVFSSGRNFGAACLAWANPWRVFNKPAACW